MKKTNYLRTNIENPLVTIITPVYNAEKFLDETIKSVLSQTYTNWEMILVDDCSTDSSYKIAKSYSQADSRIHLYQNKVNSGTAFTRNVALNVAKGDIVCLLDADDLYDPDYLEKQLNFYKSTDGPLIFCSIRRLSKNSLTNYIVPPKATAHRILHGSCIGTLSVMIDRKAIGDIRFDEDCYVEDFVFFYTILKKCGAGYGNKEVLATYRILENSKSRNKKVLIKKMWYAYHKSLKKNVFLTIFYIFCWAVHGVFKYRNVK